MVGWEIVRVGPEAPEVDGARKARAPRYLQQHAEPRDALKGQQQEGWQREPFTLGEALQPAQFRGEAHVCVPAEAAQAAGVGLEALVPEPVLAWTPPAPGPSPEDVTLPLPWNSHKAAVGLLLILLVTHIIHVHGERAHSVGMNHVAKVVDVGGRAYAGQ